MRAPRSPTIQMHLAGCIYDVPAHAGWWKYLYHQRLEYLFICFERVSWRVQHRYPRAHGQETTLGNQPLFLPSGGRVFCFCHSVLQASWPMSFQARLMPQVPILIKACWNCRWPPPRPAFCVGSRDRTCVIGLVWQVLFYPPSHLAVTLAGILF